MNRIAKAVLEWGDPSYLQSDPSAFNDLKGFMVLEGLPSSDEAAAQLLVELAEKYQKHIDHYWLLTDLMMDFKTTSQLYFLNAEKTREPDAAGRTLDKTSHLRVHLILAVVSYSKLKEVITSYGKEKRELNAPELDKELNRLRSLIDSSGIISYRNSYIAHAFAKEQGRSFALHYRRGVELIKNILASFNGKELDQLDLDEDVDAFFLKMHDESNSSSIVNLIHKFKEQIRSVNLHGYEIHR
ncbi:hypothetical protein [Pseudomonas silensiensis]|uniref:hypothetical protein n=1 Tax=Pseudomonas silensiensis TaxID=2991049 RepID=UPI003D1A8985